MAEKKFVCKEAFFNNFLVYKDKIYYSDTTAMYSMNLDGSNKVKLVDGSVVWIAEYNNHIYFSHDNCISTFSLNGKGISVIANNCWIFTVCNGVVYNVSNSSYNNIYSVEGICATSLFDNSPGYINNIISHGNKLYYLVGNAVYSVNSDGTGNELLHANAIGGLATDNSKVYYAGNEGIYSMNFDGSDNKLVSSDTSVCYVSVSNDVLYYTKVFNRQTGVYSLYSLPLTEPPVISDSDKNLGDKNTGFSVTYQVSDSDNDSLTVTESLNNTTLKTLNNAPKNTNLDITITNEMLYKLPLNTENKISICADDGKGGVSYRNYTFTRTNTAPIISSTDKDLGVATRDISQKYTVSDAENNPINITEKIDDTVIKTFVAESSKEYTIAIPVNLWVTLANGQHKLTVNATDSNNATSIRTYTFTKQENKIILDIKKPFETDAKANKILITPVWQVQDATVKVETCNNALDTNPSWEDATKEVLANQKYSFKNANKTADKWGINIRFTIIKKDGAKDMVLFNGFGGAFE